MDAQPPVPPPPDAPGTPPYSGPPEPMPPAPPGPPGPPGPPVGPAELGPIPWERPGTPGFREWFETLKLFLSRPMQAFARVPPTGGLGRPLAFAVINGWIGYAATSLYNLGTQDFMTRLMPTEARPEGFAMPPMVQIGMIFLAPIFVVVTALIFAGIVHLALLLLGGAKNGFAATVRAYCYAHAPLLLGVLPFCGGVVGGLWSLVLAILGVAALHRIGTGRAAAAVILPLILCGGCLVFAIMGAAMSMFGAGR